MNAHLIDTHLLVPRSRSSAKVKGQISGSCFSKDGCFGSISVSQTHLVFICLFVFYYYYSAVIFHDWLHLILIKVLIKIASRSQSGLTGKIQLRIV